MHVVTQYGIIILLIALVLYRRIKRSIGFQPFKARRLIIRIVLFSIIMVLLLDMSASNPLLYFYDAAGVLVGMIVVLYARKHSSFEIRGELLYYRTHIWIESIVLFLFLSRFVFRLFTLFSTSNTPSSMNTSVNSQHFISDPSTLSSFFLLAVYYIGFYSFVLKRGKSILQNKDQNMA